MTNQSLTEKDIKQVKALGFLHNRGTRCFSGRVITTNGKITANQQICIGEAAQNFGDGTVTFTSRMTIEVPGIAYENIESFMDYIAKAGLQVGGTGAMIRPVVSCKGSTCVYGLIDTFSFSEEVHKRFYGGYREVTLPHKFKIGVGGCPNSCIKPSLNDVGVMGQRIPILENKKCKGCKRCSVANVCPMQAASVQEKKLTIDKKLCINCGLCLNSCPFGAIENYQTGYKIYLGGRWGKQIAIGQPLQTIITEPETALQIIEQCILLYRKHGTLGQRFAQLIQTMGMDKVEDILLSGELLANKQDILA